MREPVDRGNIPYSAVSHPSPLPRKNRGTPAVTLAVQITLVWPKLTSTEPSAWQVKPRSNCIGRIALGARPLGRSDAAAMAGLQVSVTVNNPPATVTLHCVHSWSDAVTQSMTGFARGSVTTEGLTVTVECRSVNNRYLDLHFRMPETLREYEPQMRAQISQSFARGKLELSVQYQQNKTTSEAALDTDHLNTLQAALKQISTFFPDAEAPNQLTLLQAPGVLSERPIAVETLISATTAALKQCLETLSQNRREEGAKLAAMVSDRGELIRALLLSLRQQLPALQQAHREKLLARMASLELTADAKRLEEEIVYVLQRADVEEEMDRLDAHLDAINAALIGTVPCGRKLDFLMQELNREANTLASKSTALNTTNTAIEFKVLIEQMREQIQNIE